MSEQEVEGEWQGLYHPDAHPCSDGLGRFVKAYAIDGAMEFAFNFSMRTLGERDRRTPGMRRTKTLRYNSPLEGTPHFVVLRSFSGRFVNERGELTDRPLGALEVTVGIKEPGLLACTVRLSDKNSDDPVEVSVRGLLVFFH